jgi:hypothetical protein
MKVPSEVRQPVSDADHVVARLIAKLDAMKVKSEAEAEAILADKRRDAERIRGRPITDDEIQRMGLGSSGSVREKDGDFTDPSSRYVAIHRPEQPPDLDAARRLNQRCYGVGSPKRPPDEPRVDMPPVRPRPRGAGRPPARAMRRSARSGDSGDDDPPEPGPEPCACGRCGRDLTPLKLAGKLRADARYLNPTHRKRGQRARDADPEVSVQRGVYETPRTCRCNGNGNGRPLPEFDPDLGCRRCLKDGHRLPGEILTPPRGREVRPGYVTASSGYVTASSPSRKWRDRPSRGEPRRPVTYRSLHDTPPPKGVTIAAR